MDGIRLYCNYWNGSRMKNKTIEKIGFWILLLLMIFSLCSCGKKPKMEMTVLIRMMDIQDLWFREKMKEFEKENGVKLNVVTFDKVEDVKKMIELELKSGRKKIGLVKTAYEMVYPLVENELMISLSQLADSAQLEKDLSEYLPLASDIVTIKGEVFYIPRKLETYLLFYLKSKVTDALENWEKDKSKIDELLRKANGYGLPEGYLLEKDPDQWDFYDLLVLSYYWANHPYQGLKLPRMAHRGKEYAGTANELYTRIFESGGDQKDILEMSTEPVVDMFQWEGFFVKNNLYNPGMWEQSWSGGGIWKAISEGQVFLAFMHQIDLFFIHGGSDPTMTGYLKEPEDLGIAILPRGASLELNSDGTPKRKGAHKSNLYGWWWGIPKTSPSPELSYKLARFITNRENQIEECSRFGMFPVRKDVLEEISEVSSEDWKRHIFEVSQKQFESGTEPTPSISSLPLLNQNYLDAWYKIAVEKKIADKEKIKSILEEYAGENKKILNLGEAER